MSTAAPPNSRASLLAGLRTGGVRSTSSSIPHTAAPGATFNVPRFASQATNASVFPEEDEDRVLELPQQNMYANVHHGGHRQMPMTAAVDGPNNRFMQHQQRGMNPNSVPFSPGFMAQTPQMHPQAQALQLQMMQMELMKIQAQQYQAEMLAQAQRQQVPPQVINKRPSMTFNPPATAGPMSTSFDLRSATLSAQMRRANQDGKDDHVPMTAALGGKFGARPVPGSALNGPMRFNVDEDLPPPSTPNTTTIISGGTSLGSPAANNLTFNNSNNTPSKSDAVSSWRRGGSKGNSVLSGNRPTLSSPSVKVTPPPLERNSPPPSELTPTNNTPTTATPTTGGPKFRPQPLRFSAAVSQPLPVVAVVDSSEPIDADDSSSNGSSSKSNSNSSPTTPRSSSSLEMPLSPREEASKRLYEGLGIGRPSSSVSNNGADTVQVPIAAAFNRIVSQPVRQPRGPPSALEELGPKNFATRIRRKAIGGLGMLIGARERRELVEVY